MIPLLYYLLWGLPVGLSCIAFGLFLVCTIIFAPFGIGLVALGVQILHYPEPTHYDIRIERR